MTTTIEINDNIVNEGLKYAKVKSKEKLFLIALLEYINNHKSREISNLKGKIKFRDNYNYKNMREGI